MTQLRPEARNRHPKVASRQHAAQLGIPNRPDVRSGRFTPREWVGVGLGAVALGVASIVGIGQKADAEAPMSFPTVKQFHADPEKYNDRFTLVTAKPGEGPAAVAERTMPDENVTAATRGLIQEHERNVRDGTNLGVLAVGDPLIVEKTETDQAG